MKIGDLWRAKFLKVLQENIFLLLPANRSPAALALVNGSAFGIFGGLSSTFAFGRAM